MKTLIALFLLLAISSFGANPDYKVFRGAGGITVTTNPPTGTIIIDGSGVVASGTNSSIGASTNGTAVSGMASNVNYTAGNNMVLRGTNIGSTAHINYGMASNLSFYAGGNELVWGTWGTVFGLSNAAVGDFVLSVPDPGAGDDVTFGGIISAPTATFTGLTGSGNLVGLSGNTLVRTTAASALTNIGVGQTLYLDSSFGNDSTAQRTNLVRTYRTASNSVAAMLSGDTLIVRGGTNLIAPNPGDLLSAFGITNKNNWSIKGEPGSVWQLANLVSPAGKTNHGSILTLSGCTNWVIDGLTFVGFRTNAQIQQHFAIRLLDCGHGTIKNCNFLNWQNQGVTDLGPNHDTQNSDLKFIGNWFSWVGGTNSTIGVDGCAISVNCKNICVEQNLFTDCLRNFEQYDGANSQGLVYRDNIAYRTQLECLLLNPTNFNLVNLQIINNQDYGYSSLVPAGHTECTWLNLGGVSNALIKGNIVKGMSGVVWARATALIDCKIWNNDFSDAASQTIFAHRYTGETVKQERLSIKNNTFRNSYSTTVQVTGNNTVVSDNEFVDCNTQPFGSGVLALGSSVSVVSTNIVAVRNHIYTTQGTASGSTGIVIYPVCYGSQVYDNEITNMVAGIADAGVGTLTRPVNLVAPGSLLRTDAAGRERAVTIGANVTWDGTTLSASGGSGTPGGGDRSIQFNTNSTFGGDVSLQYQYPVGGGDPTSGKLQINFGGITNTMDGAGFGTDTSSDVTFRTAQTARWYLKAAGHWVPAISNAYDVGSYALPPRTNYGVRGVFKEGVDIAPGSGATAMARFYDTGGLKYTQLEAPSTIINTNTTRLWSDTNAGVVVANWAADGVNKLVNITLAAGQVVSGNGSGGYVATDSLAQQQIAKVEQLSKYLLPVPVMFSNGWVNLSSRGAPYDVYESVYLKRDWTHAFIEGTAYNVGSNVAAGVVAFVPWGYRTPGVTYASGPLNIYDSTSGAIRQNIWNCGTDVYATFIAATGTNVWLPVRSFYSSPVYFLAVANPADTNACLLIPPNLTNATSLVVFFHGNGGSQFDFVNLRDDAVGSDSNFLVTAKAILTNGWPILSHYAQGNAWGNAASLNDYSNAVMWATNSLIITNVMFFDGSMGGTMGLPLFAQMPSVSRIYNLSPITSLSNAYYTDLTGFSNQINTAFSTTAATFTADTAGYDPYRLATNAYGGRRVRFSASAADTIVNTNRHSYLWTNKFFTASISVTNSTGEHGNNGQVLVPDIINFFR